MDASSRTRAESREIRAGAGDALAKVFELIATPAIFGFGGWLLDERLGTFPLMTLLLGLTVLAYQGWSFARAYNASLDQALERRRAGYGAHPQDPAADNPAAVGDGPADGVGEVAAGRDPADEVAAGRL